VNSKDLDKEWLDAIIKEILEVYDYCKVTYDENNIQEMLNRLTNLNVYLARVNELLPDMKKRLMDRRGYYSEVYIELTPNKMKALVEAKTSAEERYYSLVERLSATIVHQIDAIRTQVSYIKQQLNYGG